MSRESAVATLCVAFMILITSIAIVQSVKASRPNCSSFGSRLEAQRAFDSDQKTYSRLDGDKDNIVCEDTKY